MTKQLVSSVLELFEAFDAQITTFQLETGLHCPPGCGHCCATASVETSVLEMLPLAESLWADGSAELWLERAVRAGNDGPCVFYTPDELCFGHGRCCIYPMRPLLCRLFGYSAVRDKNGRPQLAACRLVKELVPEAVDRARKLMGDPLEIPCIADAATSTTGLAPHLGHPKWPINRALGLAIERVGFALELDIGDEAEREPPPNSGSTAA